MHENTQQRMQRIYAALDAKGNLLPDACGEDAAEKIDQLIEELDHLAEFLRTGEHPCGPRFFPTPTEINSLWEATELFFCNEPNSSEEEIRPFLLFPGETSN